ncbi:hypothetical protein CHS0354_030587 [Potamilus streckersoni]|uniref:Uncharacterized protein n=1 Tax=Potamilus streckersoni TaxID=2493646 RepID=A0AAE0SDR9_9BIVA|nr:hypothetical protein CHS0354_030587 [Potamilus streckersoni]
MASNGTSSASENVTPSVNGTTVSGTLNGTTWHSNFTTTVFDGYSKITEGSLKSHILVYVLIPLGTLILVAVMAFVVVMICRRSKLDRLRHHLMPLYSFDPAEEGDWESELLEEDRSNRSRFRESPSPSPLSSPKLKFSDDRHC